MGKFDGYMIACDIDGTLIDDNFEIPTRNLDAIERFCGGGGTFVLSSGRVADGLLHYYKAISGVCRYAVVLNGGAIYDMDSLTPVYECPLADNADKVVEFVMENLPRTGIEIMRGRKIYTARANDIVKWHLDFEHLPQIDVDYKTFEKPWSKMLFAQEAEEMDAVRDILTKKFGGEFQVVKSFRFFYEVLDKNATKGAAASQLAKMLGIEQSCTMALGDNDNDLSMMEWAHIAVCPSNSTEVIKGASDKIVCDCNAGCVGEAIEYLETII